MYWVYVTWEALYFASKRYVEMEFPESFKEGETLSS